MQDKPLISVIVPIYKVEPYLKQCLDSIVNQTYENLEIILVDDGSPDNCGKICDKYAQADNRVKVIHKENGGLSDARNAGLDVATGEYIGFVDSDDFIENQMYEMLYDCVAKEKADISICQLEYYVGNDFDCRTIDKTNCKTIDKYEILKWLYSSNTLIAAAVWNKLYKKHLFNKIRFPVGRSTEDLAVMHKLLYKSKIVAITDAKLYYYRIRNDSISSMDYLKFDPFIILNEHIEFYDMLSEPELSGLANSHYMILIIWSYVRLRKKCSSEKETICKFVEMFYQAKKRKFLSASIKRSLQIMIFSVSPSFYYRLWKIGILFVKRFK